MARMKRMVTLALVIAACGDERSAAPDARHVVDGAAEDARATPDANVPADARDVTPDARDVTTDASVTPDATPPPDAGPPPDAAPCDADMNVADCVAACGLPWEIPLSDYGGNVVCTSEDRAACEASCVALTDGRCQPCVDACVSGSSLYALGAASWWSFSYCYCSGACPPVSDCARDYWDGQSGGSTCGPCDPVANGCGAGLAELETCLALEPLCQ
jgi:hypothetical protein